ncbi:MAG TPA: ribonuclease P protein component [Jatrophihabitans sp.]|nr:ribonuclease P protein component [Jatrophihabitans sp.]
MLPAAHRLRSSADFATVTRTGRRVRSGDLVVYLAGAAVWPRPEGRQPSDQTPAAESAAVAGSTSGLAHAGLIVSRKVGGSVIRHQVSRRLRAQLAGRLAGLPPEARLVVRALPSAAGVSSGELGAQLDRALAKLTRLAASSGPAR